MKKNLGTATFICHVDDIPEGQSKGFMLNGHVVFAVKKQGAVYVYHNCCPHLGVELEWQENEFLNSEKTLIQCNMHGALFVIEDGSCISGPCVGGQLQAIKSEIRGTQVYAIGIIKNR